MNHYNELPNMSGLVERANHLTPRSPTPDLPSVAKVLSLRHQPKDASTCFHTALPSFPMLLSRPDFYPQAVFSSSM